MSARDPQERSRIAGDASRAFWSAAADPAAHTAPARRAFHDRFEKQVDPDGTLDPAERAKRAAEAKSAYFSEMAKRSHAAGGSDRWTKRRERDAARDRVIAAAEQWRARIQDDPALWADAQAFELIAAVDALPTSPLIP